METQKLTPSQFQQYLLAMAWMPYLAMVNNA